MAFSIISSKESNDLETEVYETSAQGNSLKKMTEFSLSEKRVIVTLNPEEKFQTISGFGGSFLFSSQHFGIP